MARYRWDHPLDWLTDFIDSADRSPNELRALARELAQQLDSDQIQDLFQSDMDRDGFFVDLDTLPAVGSRVHWTDPDDGLCSCDGTVTFVDLDLETVTIQLDGDDGGFIEALLSEVSKL